MGLFDFNWSDGSDSIWEEDRGFWSNIGNVAFNAGGAALGTAAGFVTGGPLGAAAGAAAGWAGANQVYDGLDYLADGTYEQNALFDYGTVAAGVGGYVGGQALAASSTAAAATAGGTAAGGAAGGGGGAAGGTAGGGIGSFLAQQGTQLAIDALQGGAEMAFDKWSSDMAAAQKKAEQVDYYERNKEAAINTYEANADTTALKFMQNDLAIRQRAFDFELTGRMAKSSAVSAAGAGNIAGVSVRDTFNEISSQTSKGARRYQTTRKNAADAYYQDIKNLQVARDNQINSAFDPRQMELSDEIKRLQAIAPWAEFGVSMLSKVGDAVAQAGNVKDIREGRTT